MQQEVISEIYREWDRLKCKNPAISLRAFSKRIEIPHSALSEILNGKRRLSKKMALRIVQKLNLSEEEYQVILEKIDNEGAFDLVSLQNFKVLSHWEHFAVLNLLKLRGFKSDTSWMAKRLGISVKKIERAVKRLKVIGLLKESNREGLKRVTNKGLKTTTDVANQALQIFTQESFEMGIEALKTIDIDERDFSTVTLTINKKDIKKAKKLIEEFRYKFDKEIESVPGDEVYKLVVGFYPLTKEVSNDEI